MTKVAPARLHAHRILLAVERDGAYPGLLLQKSKLTARDLPLLTQLVYGTLKEQSLLDFWLDQALRGKKLTPKVRVNLRLALYQCAFLDAIPRPVAVDQAVELARKTEPKAVGFVNWALRTVFRQEEPFPDPPKTDPLFFLATKYSHPQWLVALWLRELGEEATEALLQANQEEGTMALRANTLQVSREELAKLLASEGVETEPGIPPDSLRVTAGRAVATEAFRKGLFMIQGEASQLIAPLLAPEKGMRVLDLAAAPGGKTTHLAQLMENEGEIVAVDLYPQRLDLIVENCQRLGVEIVETLALDGREIGNKVELPFDRVLVDAPCSGLGVMRGKPDLRWQKNLEELKELPKLQLELLTAAAAVTRVGGELCYSTCTINRGENEEVAQAFLEAHPHFIKKPLWERLPGGLQQDLAENTSQLQLLPSKQGLDGFFFALFQRIR